MQLSLAGMRTSVRLGQELGRGGEGAVFAIEGHTDRVAKIYASPPDQKKAQKLAAMAAAATPALFRIAAWPTDLLLDGKDFVRGFVMPRIVARRDIHELYSPKSRSETFPEADFRFLVHVGANIARAFAVVHEAGHVLGDVNHGNLLVGPDGTVVLIDCDSFQISAGAKVFTCDVGVPLFTAPELQGHAFRGLVRTANHDRFGLAILVFHLLFMGRHPFAGRYVGAGEMPLEKAIAECRFAYGPDRVANEMERPPGTIALETMGIAIAQHFVRAFGPAGRSGERPDGKTWLAALENLKTSLRTCAAARWHQYPGHLSACPWCAIEAASAVRLFGQRITVINSTGAVDIAALWQAIIAVPAPEPDPALPSERLWKPPMGIKVPSSVIKNVRKSLSVAFACGGLAACSALTQEGAGLWMVALYGLALAVWPHVSAERRSAADKAYAAAKADWEGALLRWQRNASHSLFAEKLSSLGKIRSELADLPNERRRRLAKLEADREKLQLQRYLDRFRIDRTKIRGIGPARTAMLASFGIETAADIDASRISQIPGFGQALRTDLLLWRQGHERNFRFNPNEPVDRRDVVAMDRELDARRESLLTTLRQGPVDLGRLNQEITSARTRLMPMLENAWTSLKIAEAHRKAL